MEEKNFTWPVCEIPQMFPHRKTSERQSASSLTKKNLKVKPSELAFCK